MLESQLDDETRILITHLQKLARSETEEDPDLIDDFVLGLNFHNPLIYSHRHNDSSYNPVIKNLVQLLLNVLGFVSALYLGLLQKILRPLSFEEVTFYFSKEMIMESLQNPSSQELSLKMLNEKLPADMAALQFLIENEVVYSLISEVGNLISFRNPDGLITKLIAGMIKASPKLIDAEKFALLVKTSTSIYPKERFFNYILALSMACMVDVSRLQWGAQLFRHEFARVMNEQTKYPNEPYISLTSNLYCAAIGKVPFSWIQPFISDLLDHVALNYSDKLAPNYSNEYIMAYQDMFVRLLESSGDSLEFILKFISRPDIDIIDIHEPQSAQFFSKVCLKNISDKGKFFNSHFSDFDVSSGTSYVVTCVLALVKDEELFELLKLLAGDFKNWKKPDIYSFLRLMASQDLSAQYLLTNLPDLVSAHLIMVDRRLSDISVWNDMRETLRSLLANTNITLGNWSSSLSNCLYEMENGRRLNKNEPRVEVEYKTS